MAKGAIVFSPEILAKINEIENNSMEYKINRKVMIDGQTVTIKARTEQEYVDKIVDRARNIKRADTDRVLFARYAQRWFLTRPTLAQSTSKTYARQINNIILPALGLKYVDEITPTDIQQMLNGMGDVARATKNKMLSVLKQILDDAVEDGLISNNPAHSKRIKVTGTASTPRTPYALEEMQYIVNNLDKIKKQSDRLFIAIIALHPMRPEEVLGLKWSDINIEKREIHIKRAVTHPDRNKPEIRDTKTEKSARTIWLSGIAAQCIDQIGPDDEFLFGGENPLSYTQMRKMCERVKNDIEFAGDITPSRFRPSVISDLYAKTQDLKFVQESAGHATVDTTLKHYINVRKNYSAGAEAIDSLYTLQPKPSD